MATTDITYEDRIAGSEITKDLLEKALRSSMNRDDIMVKDWKIEMGTDTGENGYLSTVFVTTVTSSIDGEEHKHTIFIKTLPANVLKRQTALSRNIFQKEIELYSSLLPAYHSLQEDLGVEPIVPSAPSFYYGAVKKDKAFLLMEDMRDKGYRVVDIKECLDYPHCKLVMKEIAKWHALSYALKAINPEVLKDKFPYTFQEAFYSEELSSIMVPYLNASVDLGLKMLDESTDDESIKQQAHKMRNMDLMEMLINKIKPEEPFSVICHGDFWSNNMMFKYNNDGTPIDVIFFDFQMTRYAPLTTDLATLIFNSTTGETRKNHLQDLLEIYHVNFIESLKHLHVFLPNFTIEVLHLKFKESVIFGVITACYRLTAQLAQAHERAAEENETKFEDYFKLDWKTILSKRSENNSVMKERLASIFQDALASGVW